MVVQDGSAEGPYCALPSLVGDICGDMGKVRQQLLPLGHAIMPLSGGKSYAADQLQQVDMRKLGVMSCARVAHGEMRTGCMAQVQLMPVCLALCAHADRKLRGLHRAVRQQHRGGAVHEPGPHP
jgi:hypothetical protein